MLVLNFFKSLFMYETSLTEKGQIGTYCSLLGTYTNIMFTPKVRYEKSLYAIGNRQTHHTRLSSI